MQKSTRMPKIRLNGFKLKVGSIEHRKGRHWGYTPAQCVLDGDAEGGEIVWTLPGLMLFVR